MKLGRCPEGPPWLLAAHDPPKPCPQGVALLPVWELRTVGAPRARMGWTSKYCCRKTNPAALGPLPRLSSPVHTMELMPSISEYLLRPLRPDPSRFVVGAVRSDHRTTQGSGFHLCAAPWRQGLSCSPAFPQAEKDGRRGGEVKRPSFAV